METEETETPNLPARRESTESILRKLKHYLLNREQRLPFHTAAKAAGIGVDTIRRYRRDNPQFLDAEREAIGLGVEQYEIKLDELAMNGDFQAISKLLEANDPIKYGRINAGSGGQPVVIVVDSGNYLDKIRVMREELERRQRDIPQKVVDRNPFLQDMPDVVEDEITDAEVL